LLWLSSFFLLGLCSALFFTLSIHWLILLSLIGLALILMEKTIGSRWGVFSRRSRISPLAWGVLWLAFCIGFIRQQTAQPSPNREQVSWYNNSGTVTLTGTISALPSESERIIQAKIKVQSLMLDKSQAVNPIHGTVLLWLPKGSRVEYGDELQIQGKLISPFENGEFSYKEYLARQGIYSLMTFPKYSLIRQNAGSPILAALYAIRRSAWQTLQQVLPMPEAAVLAGILLGMQDNIPEYLYQAYQASGTAHILVVSGFNIALVSALIARSFRRMLPYGWDTLASIAAILFYTLLVGAEPPVVRAAVMGILALPAFLLGRQSIQLNALVFTAALMVFFSPHLVRDVSFQLSFLATLGIILFSEPLIRLTNHFFLKNPASGKVPPLERWVREYLLVTLAAQIGVLPVLLSHFEYVSLVTLPANLLILPAQPIAMGLGGIALLAGMIFLPAGKLFAGLAWLPLFFSDQVALWMGALPFAMLKTSPRWAWIGWTLLFALMTIAVHFYFHNLQLKGIPKKTRVN